MGVEPNQAEREELAWVEGEIMNTMEKTPLKDTSMIVTSDFHEPEPNIHYIHLYLSIYLIKLITFNE